MSYELFSGTADVLESNEPKLLTKDLECGVTLEQYELKQTGMESRETVEIIGNPEKDMENWHPQTEQNSCAIACQEFVAEQLLQKDLSEEDMIRFAKEQGWYTSETGTPQGHVGDILEALGLETGRESGQTLSNLAEDLQRGRKIICAVNNMILENADYSEIPGLKANHAVEVIGIDIAGPGEAQVILNDSGVENGQGRRISAEAFVRAWNTSRNFAVTAWKED